MNFVIDNNVLLDVLFQRGDCREKLKILNQLIVGRNGYVPAASLHQLRYVVKKGAPARLGQLDDLVAKFNIAKTPAYVDFSERLAQLDLEDYLIELSARSLGGYVVTSDREFLENSSIAVHPDRYFEFVRTHTDGINFCDLRRQFLSIAPKVESRVDAVLRHGQYIMGPEVAELEEKLAAYVGVSHCIAVASGTDALLIALMALGIGAGDEVITSPFTFIATGEMIALLGAKPVFVDIDPASYNLDPALIEAAVTPRTKAIMPVSLYGQCADFEAINAVAARHSLPVIEDACQSFGAVYHGRRSCGLSTIGCTSFFPSKPLGCYGDGGACFTDDLELAARMRQIRVHGQDRRYHHPNLGINGRMDTLQAAVLLAKLEIFPEEVSARARIGAIYTQLLQNDVVTPYLAPDSTSVYAQYTVQVENRDAVQKQLAEQGVPTAVHYPVPLHLQPVFQGLGVAGGSFPIAEAAGERVMSLPMHPYLTENDQNLIVSALKISIA